MMGVGLTGRPGEGLGAGLDCEKEEIYGFSSGRELRRGGQLVCLRPLKSFVLRSVSLSYGERTYIPLLGFSVRANSGTLSSNDV
jgi:hypothetical protein